MTREQQIFDLITTIVVVMAINVGVLLVITLLWNVKSWAQLLLNWPLAAAAVFLWCTGYVWFWIEIKNAPIYRDWRGL